MLSRLQSIPSRCRPHRFQFRTSLTPTSPHPIRQTSTLRFSSSSSNKPPPTARDQLNPNNPLVQQLQKAEQLHEELATLLDKHDPQKLSNKKKKPSFLKTFFKTNKSQMINVGASFLCVCLAFQIFMNRRAAERLLKEREDQNKSIEELNDVLMGLKEEQFVRGLAMRCARVVVGEVMEEDDDAKWGWRRRRGRIVPPNVETLADAMNPIIREEIQKEIGGVCLNEEEREEKELELLQSMVSNNISTGGNDVDDVEEEVIVEKGEGEKVVRRRKFVM